MNAQAMWIAWSSLEAAMETGRGCAARARAMHLEAREIWARAGPLDLRRPLMEKMFKSLSVTVDAYC